MPYCCHLRLVDFDVGPVDDDPARVPHSRAIARRETSRCGLTIAGPVLHACDDSRSARSQAPHSSSATLPRCRHLRDPSTSSLSSRRSAPSGRPGHARLRRVRHRHARRDDSGRHLADLRHQRRIARGARPMLCRKSPSRSGGCCRAPRSSANRRDGGVAHHVLQSLSVLAAQSPGMLPVTGSFCPRGRAVLVGRHVRVCRVHCGHHLLRLLQTRHLREESRRFRLARRAGPAHRHRRACFRVTPARARAATRIVAAAARATAA